MIIKLIEHNFDLQFEFTKIDQKIKIRSTSQKLAAINKIFEKNLTFLYKIGNF